MSPSPLHSEVEEGELCIDESVEQRASEKSTPVASPHRSTSALAAASAERVSLRDLSPEPVEKAPSKPPTPAQALTPVGAKEYAPFPTPGTDSAPFLNAMFGIFNRAMAPSGAPAGPVGSLAFQVPGYKMPFQQASFMPFIPFTGVNCPSPASAHQSPRFRMPSSSPAHSMTEQRAPLMPRSRTALLTSRHS